jgi:hypothetical protein
MESTRTDAPSTLEREPVDRPRHEPSPEPFTELPPWACGFAIGLSIFLLRKPIWRLTRALLVFSTPFLVPLVVTKLVEAQERRSGHSHLVESAEPS